MGLFKKNYVIGLDIGTASVKLAQFLKREDSRLILIKANTVEIEKDKGPEQALAEALSGIDLRDSKFIAALNSAGIMLKRAIVPNMPLEELKEAVSLEAKNYFPFNISESRLDFEVSSEVMEREVKKIEILAGVCPQRIIKERLDLLHKFNIQPQALIPGSLALLKVLKLKNFSQDLSVAALDIGKTFCDLIIIKAGKIVFNRRLPVCGDDFTQALTTVLSSASGRLELSYSEAEKIKRGYGIPQAPGGELIENKITAGQLLSLLRAPAEKLSGEIERSFDFYREESGGNKVDRLILFGGGAKLNGLDRFIAKELGLLTEVYAGLEGIKEKDSGLSPDLPEHILASAIGAGLGKEPGINFLPLEIKDQTRRLALSAGIKAGLSALVSGLALIFIGLRINSGILDQKITSARLELKAIGSDLREAGDLLFIHKTLRNESYWEDVLKEISNVLPADMYLKSISAGGGLITLKGEAVSLNNPQEGISDFIKRLSPRGSRLAAKPGEAAGSAGIFKNVRPISIQQSEKGREFQIQMETD